MDIDHIAKDDGRFPKPGSGEILVVDGFGLSGMNTIYPASLLEGILLKLPPVTFYKLFSDDVECTATRYKLPDSLQIRYGGNRRYQYVFRGEEEVFHSLYSRDYNNIDIWSYSLLERAGVWHPGENSKPADMERHHYLCKEKLWHYLFPTEEIDPPLLVEYLTWREGVPYVNGVPASREDIDRSLRGE